MHPVHKLAFRLLGLALFAGASALAQSPAAKPLVVSKVDDNVLLTLKGNTPPAALARNDRGRVSPSMPMTDMILVLRRSPEMQAAFDAFVESQYEPASPNYHHWLQPAEVGEKFGPAPGDVATVSAWLTNRGLSVDGMSQDRMTIRFSGTARQVEQTFHTELHNLVVKGDPHFSNMTDPQIPMALEPVVVGPKALHNFIPRPLHRLGGKATLNTEKGTWQHVVEPNAAIVGPRPEIGFSCGTGCQLEDVTPFDFATIYNVAPLWTSGTDGTGQTIAIAGRSDVRASDVSTFRSTFGLPAGTFNLIKNGTDPNFCTGSSGLCTLNDQIENALDVEWSGAVAKGATIDLVVTQQTNTNDSIYESANYIVGHNTAPILNVSYGLCELGLGTAGNTLYNTLWQTASTQGIAVFVATGDSGSPACDQTASSGPYGAQFGLAVSGIASTGYNTAVGGTDLNWGTTASTYWNTSNDSTNSSTAKGYMPETAWNDSCTNPLEVTDINTQLGTSYTASQICYLIATNQIGSSNPQQEQLILNLVNAEGGGGGVSNCTTSDGSTVASCSGGYGKPTWQTGVSGIPADVHRAIPDVSFFAGNGFNGSAYLICVSDWGTCLSRPISATEPAAGEIGGTSAASPAMAGVMALINQKAGSSQGNPNLVLYSLAAKQNYASCKTETVTNSSQCYFNDIDTGTIAMPCAAGSPNCTLAASTNTYGVLSGFDAGVGYDQATGLGSLNVANVVNGWTTAVTGTDTATVAVSATPSTFTSLQGTAVTVTVTGAGATPTGTVVLTSGTFTSASKSLTGGSVTFNLSPGVLAVGTDTITATYSGDSVYTTATGTTSVTITLVNYTVAAAAAAAVSKGGTTSSTITVSSTNGYSGSVAVTCALTSSPAGATHSPTCAVSGSPVTLSSTTTSGQVTATVSTTAAQASLQKPNIGGWAEAGGGVVLALLVFFGIPARRREWRAFAGMLVLLFTLGSLVACGGGGGGGTTPTKDPGTTSGSYTFTVTGTGTPAVTPAATTTFTVTVN